MAKLFALVAPGRARTSARRTTSSWPSCAAWRAISTSRLEIVGLPDRARPGRPRALAATRYLSADQRRDALALSAALQAAAEAYRGDPGAARALLLQRLQSAPGLRVDYAEVVDPDTLEPLQTPRPEPVQALLAAFVGTTRLIDNRRLTAPR